MVRFPVSAAPLALIVVSAVPARAEMNASAPESERTLASRRPSVQSEERSESTRAPSPREKRPAIDDLPRTGLVDSSVGTSHGSAFAGFSGALTSANSEEQSQAGVVFGGSPLERLTLYGLLGRDSEGRFAPSATVHYRFLGGYGDRFAFGALARYKAEGFTEAGGEAELGLTAGVHRARLHLDGNLVGGVGVEEEETGELDTEAKLRFGYDTLAFLRLGAMSQLRVRVAGDRKLAGGRIWDVMGGAELSAWAGAFLLSASGGPTTVGVEHGVGAFGMLTLAGVAAL